MALDLTCPTCRSENTQRLTIMKSQQSFTGSAGQTALAAHLKPPAKPWVSILALVIGLGVLAMSVVVSFWARTPWPVIPVFTLWIGAGLWMRKAYQQKLRDWERYLDAHFICLRCGALFKPSREVPSTHSAIKMCLSSTCARQIPREAKSCPYCGLAQVPRLAKA